MYETEPETNIILGLNGCDRRFQEQIKSIFSLDISSHSDQELLVYLFQETLREIVDALDGDFNTYLKALHALPNIRYFHHLHQLQNHQVLEAFREAILEFGVHVGFILQQTPYYRKDLDYFMEHHMENALVLKLFPKGYVYA